MVAINEKLVGAFLEPHQIEAKGATSMGMFISFIDYLFLTFCYFVTWHILLVFALN